MQRKLSGIENVTVFVDDILIYTKTIEEHIEVIRGVLKCLAENNIIINLEKCEFIKNKINYLGFEIDGKTFSPDKSRLENLKPWKTPRTVASYRSF